ncbi:hypothetical protein [Aeromonas aquatica]|nr:hypothetical protein [Aeromonas aquatica]
MVAVLGLPSEQRAALANALNQQLAAEQQAEREEKNKPTYQRR